MSEGLWSSFNFEIKWYLKRFSPATHTTLKRICSTAPGVLMVAWLPLVARTGDTLEKIYEKPNSVLFILFLIRNVHVWDVDSQKLVYKLPGHLGSVNDVDFHRCRLEVLGWGEEGGHCILFALSAFKIDTF